MATETIARLRISVEKIGPVIWRLVDLLTTGSLEMLHVATQAAMVWRDHHLSHFEVGDQRYGIPTPK